MRTLYLAAILAISSLGLSAHANQIFTLSNVTLSTPGTSSGTLTGTFTTNDALNQVLTYNITASMSGSFAGYNYTPIDSAVTASTLPSQYFQLDNAASTFELRLYFANGLSASGGTITPLSSYEYEAASGGARYVSGSVVGNAAVTPEPSSLVLLSTGLLGVAGAIKRRFV